MNWQQDNVKSDSFSLEIYRETMKKAQSLGYEFVQIRDALGELPVKAIILRHDIEYSVRCALNLARLEHELGIKSSYYVLVHSIFYNPFTPENTDSLLEMASLGHEIGLHYETYYFEDRNSDPVDGIRHDVENLSNMLGIDIKSISQHRPARSSVCEGLSKLFIDAYDRRLIYDMKYISDSGCKWRGESLIEILGEHDVIHALLHPDYWNFQADDNLPSIYKKIAVENGGIIMDECDLLIQQNYEYLVRREKLDAERQAKYEASLKD